MAAGCGETGIGRIGFGPDVAVLGGLGARWPKTAVAHAEVIR